MGELGYQRTIIAYHGCDESVVTGVLLHGQRAAASANDYDWLGRGIYLWENCLARWSERAFTRRTGNCEKPTAAEAVPIVQRLSMDKLFAGLRDAWRVAGAGKGLRIAIRLANYLDGQLAHVNDEQMRRITSCEFGGMNC